ncbi:MAG: LemA family protein [Nanoarchaeota archaeon]|nr:LemA family protein [Nanoarchaeota archaeon]
MNHKLKYNLALVQKYKKDIVADEDEKLELYATLNNLLVKETDFEKEMLKESKKGKKNTNVTIKPKIKDSDVDDFRINAVQEYLDKYPEYASKSSFKKILDKISETEKGIKDTKKKYNKAVSEVLRELAYWPRNLMEAEDLVKRFKEQLKEAKEKLGKMRYLKGIAYKLANEKEKMKVNIHTLYYKMDEMENTIKQFKSEVTKAKRQDLEEMDY